MKTLLIRWFDLNNSDNDCYQIVSTEKDGLFEETINFMNRNVEILNLDLKQDHITGRMMLVVRYRFRKGSLWTYTED
jgi:hypothetical protein